MKAQNKIRFARFTGKFRGVVDEIVHLETHANGLIATTIFTEPIANYFPEESQLSPLSKIEEHVATKKWEEFYSHGSLRGKLSKMANKM